ISNNYIRCIYRDDAGISWVGTWGGGINKIVKTKQHFTLYQNDPNSSSSLGHNRILELYPDNNGYIWIGTDGGGLNRFNKEDESFIHYKKQLNNPFSLSNNYVISIAQDLSDNFWIGTWGGGINKFNEKTGKFIRFLYDPDDSNSISNNIILHIICDSEGHLWFGTNGGGLCKIESSELNAASPKIKRYHHDRNNPNSLNSDFIRILLEDDEGNIWIGTTNAGLNKYQKRSQSFESYIYDPEDSSSISSNYINTIYQPVYDKDIMWIGTFNGGLNKLVKGYKDSPSKFEHYTIEHGLPSNNIYAIIEDDNENLWISTGNGISRFNPSEGVFYNFDVRDGLQGNDFSVGVVCKGNEGELYFGGINGFNAFYPTKIKKNLNPPEIVLTDLKIFNESVSPGPFSPIKVSLNETNEVELSYSQDSFLFEFSALDLTFPYRNRYAYMLEGFNEDWIYTDASRRYASYTSLSPGEYIFRVKGSNSDGVWNNEGKTVKVTIVPPFWNTWWFLTLSLIIIGIIAFISFNRRFKNVRMKIELKAAHNAQMSIMPQSDPKLKTLDISGICTPANEVGGDFFDYLWLDEHKTKFGIAVGDVSGKAMTSAMTAVMTNGMLLSTVGEGKSVGKIMTDLNYPVFLKTDRKMFIALCLVSINIEDLEMSVTNAGLVHPIIKSGKNIDFIESVGPKFPLGAIINTKYEERKIKLKKDDVIILYSDGISEAQNNAKEFFGTERVINLLNNLNTSKLNAKEIKTKFINAINEFCGNAQQHDDLTIVIVKIK
ncbi:SpoIIE family protein phosphatase, partial [Bacteroidota bacterium]